MNSQKNVFIIHTSGVSVNDLNQLFREFAPQAIVRNIIDDSLLAEVLANGGVTPCVRRRMCDYFLAAEAAGADMIFNQCSSVGEAADLAASLVRVPVVKVDEEMAEVACRTGKRIGVVATLGTTLGPTVRLVETTARKLGIEVEIVQRLCAGAFDKLIAGDRSTHNAMVIGEIRNLAETVDVIVCAQGSMVALLPDLGEMPVPVLTSPRMGVQRAARVLATL